MSRRKREKVHEDKADVQSRERFIGVLRRLQLASAGVMLVGVTLATLICAGEFNFPWLIAAGGVVLAAGLAFYGVCGPLARWYCKRRPHK